MAQWPVRALCKCAPEHEMGLDSRRPVFYKHWNIMTWGEASISMHKSAEIQSDQNIIIDNNCHRCSKALTFGRPATQC